MNASKPPQPPFPRTALLHAGPDWNVDARRLLDLARQLHARGFFTVLVAPAPSPLARHARQAGLRVLDLGGDSHARRQLRLDLQEFGLTLLHAHDPDAMATGRRLRRTLKIPLAQTRDGASATRGRWLARWNVFGRRPDAMIDIGSPDDVLAAYRRLIDPPGTRSLHP
jgi:hypothetical protein